MNHPKDSTPQNSNPNELPEVTAPGTVTYPDGHIVTYDYVDLGGPEQKLLPTRIIEQADAPETTWTTHDIPPEEIAAAKEQEALMKQHAREVAAEISQDRLLEYAESTRHRRPCQGQGLVITPLTQMGSARNPLCGDEINLTLRVADDRVKSISFDARGCIISQAAAAMLCEHVEGRSVEEVGKITEGRVLELIGIPLSPTRRVCALLALQCLRDALGE